jgi:hypothetical protein
MYRGIPFVLHPEATDYICVATSPLQCFLLFDRCLRYIFDSVTTGDAFRLESSLSIDYRQACFHRRQACLIDRPVTGLRCFVEDLNPPAKALYLSPFLFQGVSFGISLRADITCRSKRILSLTGGHYITRVNGSLLCFVRPTSTDLFTSPPPVPCIFRVFRIRIPILVGFPHLHGRES